MILKPGMYVIVIPMQLDELHDDIKIAAENEDDLCVTKGCYNASFPQLFYTDKRVKLKCYMRELVGPAELEWKESPDFLGKVFTVSEVGNDD